VVPNLAIVREIQDEEPDCRILYLGTNRGPEKQLAEKAKLAFKGIESRPFSSPRRPSAFARFIFGLAVGLVQSLITMIRFRPHVVIATGGYVSVPTVLAAAILRRPIFLHEQNARPGKANLFLARFATKIGVSFEESLPWFPAKKTELTGYPVRQRIAAGDPAAARDRLRIPKDAKVAFILGGSMGARSINRATVEGLSRLLDNEETTVIHSTGLTATGYYDAWGDTNDRLKSAPVAESSRNRYILRRYFDQIEDAYAASDLVVARAGAGVLMELATLGKPALLIPKSDGVDNHQLVNALTMKEHGSAEVIFEEIYEAKEGPITRVHGDQLARKINELLRDEVKLSDMARSAHNFAIPNAGPQNATLVRSLAHNKRRVMSTSVQVLVGELTAEDGEAEELFFPVTTIGHAGSSDIRLRDRGQGDRALVRRSGSSRENTTYSILPRKGRVAINGKVIDRSTPLQAGQALEIGANKYTFQARIETREQSPRNSRVLASVLVTGFGTLLSRIFGLGREVVLASTFGAGRVMDIIVACLTASNLFRRIFAENAVDSAFLPTFVMLYQGGRKKEAIRLFRTVLTSSTVITLLLVVAAAFTVPYWLPVMVPGFAAKGFLPDAVKLTRLMLPYLTLITIASVFGAVLKAFGRFSAPAYASVMYSIGIMCGALLYPTLGIVGMGVGLILGGFGQVLMHLPPLLSKSFRRRTGLSFAPALNVNEPGMRKVRSTAPKIVADVTITKIGSVVDLAIVSMLATGSVSALYYGLLLFQLPFALISQSINTVALKEYAENFATRDQAACRRIVTTGVNWNLFLLLPTSALMIVLARPTVDLLLNYGVFQSKDSIAVATALSCYAVGLVGWGLQGLMGRFYAARLELGQAVVINLCAIVLNITLSISFVLMGMSIAGVALGTSIAFLANGAFRVWHMRRNMMADGGGFEFEDILPSGKRAIIASLGAAFISFLTLQTVQGFDALPTFLSRLFVFSLPATTGCVSYLVLAWALKSPEMDDVLARLRRQIPQAPPSDQKKTPLNVYCLRPEQLLKVALSQPDSVRDANLTGRVRDFLGKENWKQRNIGVKLVGILKIRSLKYNLVKIVQSRTPAPLLHRMLGGDFEHPGFVRRNAIHSLRQIESLDLDVERALLTGLGDSYFEVRAAACDAIAAYSKELTPAVRRLVQWRLKSMVTEKNFEVARAAVKALTAAALDARAAEILMTLHYHPNWQVRHAVVGAYYDLYKRGILEDRDLIRRRLDDILITCDSFTPTFELKETMSRVRSGLQGDIPTIQDDAL
jgi:murein biosynthesis integral membrane protein MurJ